MEGKLPALVRTDFFGRLGIQTLRWEKDPKKRRRAIGMAILYLIVGVVLAGYCFAIAYGLGYMGMGNIIPGYALTITSVITLIFTFLKSNGILFGARDYDLLMAFPLRTTTVITAKFFSMYLNNLIFAAVVMISMGIGFGIWRPVHAGTILIWLVTILLTPLLPMTLAAMIGVCIAAIGAGFRHKVMVQVLLTVGLIVGVFAISFWAQGKAVEDEAAFVALLADLSTTLSGAIHRIYPVSAWFDHAVNDGNLVDFLLLVGVSLGIYAAFAFTFGNYYRKINTALKSHHTVSAYQMGELKTSSVPMALAKKEARRFFSSTLYMTNIGVGLLLAVILSVVCAIMGVDKILALVNLPESVNIKPLIANVMPFFIAMLVNMCNTASVSLSLEGRNLWVVKSLPIVPATLLQGKMLFNIMLALPFSLLSSLLLMFALRVTLVLALGYLFFSVASVLFSTVLGMWINLCFPNYSWQNEVEVIKQGMSSMFGIMSGMLGYLALGAAAVFFNRKLPGEWVLLLFGAVLGVAAFLMYRRVVGKHLTNV